MTSPRPMSKGFFRSRTGIVFLLFAAIAAFFLLTEHTAHIFGALPYLFLFSCMFLHMLMHNGHGNHGGHRGGSHAGHAGGPPAGGDQR